MGFGMTCSCCDPAVPLLQHTHRPVRVDYQYDPPRPIKERIRPTPGPDFY